MGNPVVLIYLNYLIFNVQIVTRNCPTSFPAGKQVIIVVEFLRVELQPFLHLFDSRHHCTAHGENCLYTINGTCMPFLFFSFQFDTKGSLTCAKLGAHSSFSEYLSPYDISCRQK